MPNTRRPTSAIDRAEALFKAATTKPAESASPNVAAVPPGRELVSLRIDREALAFFQDEGAGWQDRINEALRKAAGLN